MKPTWRWFGDTDPISINAVSQTGAKGVVSALHHLDPGVVWSGPEIAAHQEKICNTPSGEATGLSWDVVESLPVSEEIKQRKGNFEDHILAYKDSLTHLAAAGIRTVCYNFMPVIDWTRTDTEHRQPNGATCMRFDYVDFAVFDVFLLRRENAKADFPAEVIAEAQLRYGSLSQEGQTRLIHTIIAGLPGSAKGYHLDEFRKAIDAYKDITPDGLRNNLRAFLAEIVPHAEQSGIRMAIHPDDPPFPLLGLPRIVSTLGDYKAIGQMHDSPANGFTLCSGSLGARGDNDLVDMFKQLKDRIYFLHLRNVARESETVPTSFHEAEHLAGAVAMDDLVCEIVEEEIARSHASGTPFEFIFRPDHGWRLISDFSQNTLPGYPCIGRLKGMAEIMGLEQGLRHAMV
ncbi:mannonate dehydratase [Rhodophyticola sp. CCM32]|uniref:mannonate dehydratase n=1 Tax=Rhodophyticola sp. CCM32 TaxID=2916397 RepID=UPI00107F6F86|nr:mannonate dehydratase [Rhodophyticola sp. CCM32]QBY00194.1 mannonate dehydratase [Rhodophyticola sp. CCM32]